VCVITNIGQCHLEFLIDRDGILRAKSEIFDYMNPEGVVCLNGDDDKLITVENVHGRRPVFFGMSDGCDIQAVNIENLGLEGSEADVCEKHATATPVLYGIRLYIPGEHMVSNALAAIAVGRALGLTQEEMISGIAATGSVGGRSNIIRDEKLTIIDDCYNANPVSVKAAIELLQSAKTRRVALLGDMFELGEKEKELHRGVGDFLATKEIERVICVGELAKEIYDGARAGRAECFWYADKKELTENIGQLIKENDTVLIKASHGMGFAELVAICSSHTWL